MFVYKSLILLISDERKIHFFEDEIIRIQVG